MSNKQKDQELKVHLIPVNDKWCSDPVRISELRALVAHVVLSSNKRGRPRKCSEEGIPYAA